MRISHYLNNLRPCTCFSPLLAYAQLGFDYARLRSAWRIIGSLRGSSARSLSPCLSGRRERRTSYCKSFDRASSLFEPRRRRFTFVASLLRQGRLVSTDEDVLASAILLAISLLGESTMSFTAASLRNRYVDARSAESGILDECREA